MTKVRDFKEVKEEPQSKTQNKSQGEHIVEPEDKEIKKEAISSNNKLLNGDVYDLRDGHNLVKHLSKEGGKFSYAFGKNLAKIEREIKHMDNIKAPFEEGRKKLLEKYCKKVSGYTK